MPTPLSDGKTACHPLAQDRRGAAGRLLIGPSELRPAAKQQAPIRREAEIVEKVFRVERHAPPRQQRRGEALVERLGGDDVAANRHEAALQRGHGRVRIAVGRDQQILGLDIPGGGPDAPHRRLLFQRGHAGSGHDHRSRTGGGRGQTSNVLRRVQSAAAIVDEDSVISVAADLPVLLGARQHPHLVIEHTGEHRLLFQECVEVRRLERRLQMAGACVLALDAFVFNQRLEPRDRVGRNVEQLSRANGSEALHERRHVELHAREHLAAVARARAPADLLTLDDDDDRADPGQLTRRRQAGVAGADDDDVRASREVCVPRLLALGF